MTVRVLTSAPHNCDTDGHVISLRLTWDMEFVRITPRCDICDLLMLPSSSMSGRTADWLMRLVEKAQWAKEAPPEAYEGLFAE